MSGESISELYFIGLMMFLILILCAGATYIFFRQYYREKAATEKERKVREKKPSKRE